MKANESKTFEFITGQHVGPGGIKSPAVLEPQNESPDHDLKEGKSR